MRSVNPCEANPRRRILTILISVLAGAALATLGTGCSDSANPTSATEGSDSSNNTPGTNPAPTTGNARLRVAQATLDARTIDILVDGSVLEEGVAYQASSGFSELSEGTHRVQVFAAGNRTTALVEANLDFTSGIDVTLVLVGRSPIEMIPVIHSGTIGERAVVTFFNATQDFPANLDLGVINGPMLSTDVPRNTGSSPAEVISGIYSVETFRAGTPEQLATLVGANLPAGQRSVIVAVGSLSRGDLDLFLVSN